MLIWKIVLHSLFLMSYLTTSISKKEKHNQPLLTDPVKHQMHPYTSEKLAKNYSHYNHAENMVELLMYNQKCYEENMVTEKRQLSCNLMFYLKITGEFMRWSSSVNFTIETEDKYHKIKADILEKCYRTLPDTLIDKVTFLHFIVLISLLHIIVSYI